MPYLLLLACTSVLCLLKRRWVLPGMALAALSWGLFQYQARLDTRLDPALAGTWLTVTGTVASVPRISADAIQFHFRPDPVSLPQGGAPQVPNRLLLSWYRNWPDIRAGQRWRFEARLKPPWGRVNFSGGDRERWLFAQGTGATGTIRDGNPLESGLPLSARADELRETIRDRIAEVPMGPEPRGIVLALAIADRSAMGDRVSTLLQLTGTSHLLAISGLHIGLAAAGGILLARLLIGVLSVGRPGRSALLLSLSVGLAVAAFYAVLADLGVSTLRSCAMLFAAVTALLATRSIHPFRALVLALAGVLLLDPFVPLRAGFWFSFLAVAALLGAFQPRPCRMYWFSASLLAQAAVIVILLPVSSVWFAAFSLSGFAANLVAIPWVSFFLVPFVLGGISLSPLAPDLAVLCWSIAGHAARVLLWFLEAVSRIQPELLRLTPLPLWQTALALAGGVLLLLPRGISWRWCGAFLLLPLFLPVARSTGQDVIHAEVLDVGQGTALIVEAGGKTLLYDSGPGDGALYDMVDTVIAPALASRGVAAPERILISHGDMDHAGGLPALQRLYPRAGYAVNLPAGGAPFQPCRAGLHWDWAGIEFTALHPSPGLPYLGNDSSCVISIRAGANGLLLSGDISSRVEARLVAAELAAHPVILVPHHGSLTSSGTSFIDALGPAAAIVTAGIGNRFGFPREEVRQRYLRAGSDFWETGACGALRITLHPDGKIRAESARRQRQRLWRWPAARNCP